MQFKTYLLAILATALIISGCGQAGTSESAVQTAIAQTQLAENSTDAEDGPTSAPQATNTPIPSPTPIPPTETPQPTQAADPSQRWAKNYVGAMESGGVTIEIVRVVVGYKSAIPDQPWSELNDLVQGWEDIEVVGELIFRVSNNTDETVSVYPDQGSVQIGNEQIELSDYMMFGSFGDDVGGDIHPGVTKIGGLWFGIRRSTPEEVDSMIYRASAPYSSESFSDLGPAYEIEMEFPSHPDEEIPEELQ